METLFEKAQILEPAEDLDLDKELEQVRQLSAENRRCQRLLEDATSAMTALERFEALSLESSYAKSSFKKTVTHVSKQLALEYAVPATITEINSTSDEEVDNKKKEKWTQKIKKAIDAAIQKIKEMIKFIATKLYDILDRVLKLTPRRLKKAANRADFLRKIKNGVRVADDVKVDGRSIGINLPWFSNLSTVEAIEKYCQNTLKGKDFLTELGSCLGNDLALRIYGGKVVYPGVAIIKKMYLKGTPFEKQFEGAAVTADQDGDEAYKVRFTIVTDAGLNGKPNPDSLQPLGLEEVIKVADITTRTIEVGFLARSRINTLRTSKFSTAINREVLGRPIKILSFGKYPGVFNTFGLIKDLIEAELTALIEVTRGLTEFARDVTRYVEESVDAYVVND